MTTYTCPVCGFSGLEFPPEDYYICPCCGTEFGYDDLAHTRRELRNMWLRNGGQWFNVEVPQFLTLHNWNAWGQLDTAGLPYDVVNPVKQIVGFDVPIPGHVIGSVQITQGASFLQGA